jgi:protein-S-isoprenylcysteine O-methyltransferase Ste14
MGENPHFESTVRIQAELGHRVITTGPYRMVRHPGYAAGIALLLGMALTLGSGVALAVAALTALALVVRTALEDRFLRQRLPGYREFALRTRFRLVPGLW